MYTMSEIFDEAWRDKAAARSVFYSHKSVFYNGVKMSASRVGEQTYTLENIGKGGNYYTELNEEEINVFLEKGWRQGVYNVAIKNHQNKIEVLNRAINRTTKSKKIDEAKKEMLISEYNNLLETTIEKLNKIKSRL